jgi:hypothetical protein
MSEYSGKHKSIPAGVTWKVSFPGGPTYYFFTLLGAESWMRNEKAQGMSMTYAVLEEIPDEKRSNDAS